MMMTMRANILMMMVMKPMVILNENDYADNDDDDVDKGARGVILMYRVFFSLGLPLKSKSMESLT